MKGKQWRVIPVNCGWFDRRLLQHNSFAPRSSRLMWWTKQGERHNLFVLLSTVRINTLCFFSGGTRRDLSGVEPAMTAQIQLERCGALSWARHKAAQVSLLTKLKFSRAGCRSRRRGDAAASTVASPCGVCMFSPCLLALGFLPQSKDVRVGRTADSKSSLGVNACLSLYVSRVISRPVTAGIGSSPPAVQDRRW